jgi:hypothetical protein
MVGARAAGSTMAARLLFQNGLLLERAGARGDGSLSRVEGDGKVAGLAEHQENEYVQTV